MMNVEPLRPRRRKSAPAPRSHEEIYDLVKKAEGKATDAVHRTDLLTEVSQRIEKKLDEALKALGGEREDERGELVGTGIVGRLMRLEHNVAKRFGLYDGWVKLGMGFTAAVLVLGPVIWWLTSDKLSIVLK